MRWLPLLLLLGACAGGGGGEPAPLPAIEQQVAFGTVRADAPTSMDVLVPNPFEAEATAEDLGGAGGPFAPGLGSLPAVVPDRGNLVLRVVFTPAGPGAQAGEIRLRFVADRREQEVVLKLAADVETPALALLTPTLAFPTALIGEEKRLDILVRNPNALTPVNVTSITAPPAEFTTSFQPRAIFAGETINIRVTYKPVGPGDYDFDLDIANDVGGALRVRVTAFAETWASEQLTDFGSVPVSGGATDWLEVDVPPDAISISIEGVPNSSAVVGLLAFEGPGGKVYENDQATGLFLWTPGFDGVFAATLPQSDDPDVQLVPGGGTYRFRLYHFSGSGGSIKVRAIVENRLGAAPDQSRIDLNVFLAPGLGISGPSTDTKLQDVLSRLDDIFAQIDLQVGDVDYYQLSNPAYNVVTSSEFPQLLAESFTATETRMNVFFVQTALGGGVLGVAASLPGPKLNGSPVSGVMVDYDFSNAAAVGQVTAHEIGHYLGLYHTAEQSGNQWDIIGDTLECPASGTNATCTTPGGGYLMHWQYIGSSMPLISDGQAHVILGHPLVDPLSPLSGLLALAQKKAPAPAWVELPPGFCATCAGK